MLIQKPFFLKVKLLLFIVIGLNFYSKAQQNEYNFENLTIKDGLAHNNVYSIYQDKAGYLWFGTQDGLNKYDGYKFYTYQSNPNNPNSLTTSNFGKIFQDSSGVFWFGTFGGGIDLYDPNTNKFINLSNIKGDSTSLSNNLITFIFQDSYNEIWVGTANGGLNKYNKEKKNFTRYIPNPNDRNSLSDEYAKCICETHDGTLWIGTENGLNKFNRKTETFTHYNNEPTNKNSLSGNFIQNLLVDDENNIWIGLFRGGLNKLNPETGDFTRYRLNTQNNKNVKDNSIDYLFIDSFNNFWVGTYEAGLFKFDKKTGEFKHFDDSRFSDEGLYCNRIEYIFEDRSNILWIATRGNGIWKLDLKPRKFYNLTRNPESKNSLPDASVTAVDTDNKGNLWIGTDGGGLAKYNIKTKSYTFFQNKAKNSNSLSGNRVWSVYVDKEGVVWAGTFSAGLNRIEYRNGKYNFTIYKHDPNNSHSISNNQINTIKEDKYGNLWIGTLFGLNRLEKKGKYEDYSFDVFYHNTPQTNISVDNYVVNICIDYKNRIWVASANDGLMQFIPDSSMFIRYMPKHNQNGDSIRNYRVYHIYEDNKRNLWVGTAAFGIVKFDIETKSFSVPLNSDLLLGKTIFGILEDDEDNLWISTSNTLVKYNLTNSEIHGYGYNDGLVGVGFNRNAVCKDKNGNLYFGSNSALSYFNPKELKHNQNLPKTVITSITVLNKPIFKTNLLPFEKFIDGNKILSLSWKDYFFSIEFAALDYTSPTEHRYKYMLENFDENWIDAGKKRMATYTNLDPGTYVFKVKGCNNDKVWNETPTELTIKVIPPFWKRFWFYGIELCILLLIIYAIVRIRTYVLIEDKKKLEQNVVSRTEQINQQKEELRVQAQYLAEVNDNLEQQVLERTADLEIAKNKAEESDRLKSAFLANMSHEIRTPMNAIIAFSNLIINNDGNDEEKLEYGEIINNSCERLLNLVDDIIDISKIEVGQLDIKPIKTNISDIITEIYNINQNQTFVHPDVDFSLNLPPNLSDIYMYTDPKRLHQILTNLVSNALKFTSKGNVELGYYLNNSKNNDSKNIVFFVKDTGIGLEEEEIPQIFERFRKLASTKNKIYSGSGIGLAITKNLVKLLDGEIKVKSQPGVGTEFYISFNLTSDQTVEQQKIKKISINNKDKVFNWTNKKILIGEDEEFNYKFLEKVLQQTGVKIMHGSNGKEVIELFNKEPDIDLVLLDIKMPEVDGYEVIERIRRKNKQIPVVAQTAYAMAGDREKLINAGFTNYISKPIKVELLLEMIDGVLIN